MRRPWFRSLSIVCALAATAFAHFPYVVPDAGNASAKLVMSETFEPDPEVEIEILAGAKLSLRTADGKDTPLQLTRGDNCMLLPLPGSGTRVVHGLADLGVMKRGRPHVLRYYPKTIVGDAFDPSTKLQGSAPVELVPLRDGAAFRLELSIEGKPAPQVEVRVVMPDGSEKNCVTDASGRTEVLEVAGRYGAWARHWVDQPGERDGEHYEQVRHYATLVFDVPPRGEAAQAAAHESPKISTLPALPEAVASFGAVECNGWLYVYGGHTADRHDYSTASISGRFHRLDLRAPKEWQELGGGVHAQGLNLAAHGGKVYRVGGMEPRNAPDSAADRYSIDEVACFDPSTSAWTELAPLPRPRSSHDVVVVGDQLLVIGGWWMKGRGAQTEWLDTVDVLDLAVAQPKWRSIPQPFARRALIVAALGSRVFVIGGFDADDNEMLDVDILDLSTKTWTKGPPIPGPERNGFGPAACAHDGSVFLSVGTGDLFRLGENPMSWEPFARTTPRIVHRLVPFRDQILVIGGAAGERMLDLIEAVHVAPRSRAATAPSASNENETEK